MLRNVIENQRIRNIAKVVILLIWLSAIFYLSSKSYVFSVEVNIFDIILKKSGHFIGYGFLYLFFYKVITLNKKITYSQALVLSFIFTLLYAISDELHQSFVPSRNPSYIDVIIDLFGAVTFASIINFYKKIQTKNPSKRYIIKL